MKLKLPMYLTSCRVSFHQEQEQTITTNHLHCSFVRLNRSLASISPILARSGQVPLRYPLDLYVYKHVLSVLGEMFATRLLVKLQTYNLCRYTLYKVPICVYGHGWIRMDTHGYAGFSVTEEGISVL